MFSLLFVCLIDCFINQRDWNHFITFSNTSYFGSVHLRKPIVQELMQESDWPKGTRRKYCYLFMYLLTYFFYFFWSILLFVLFHLFLVPCSTFPVGVSLCSSHVEPSKYPLPHQAKNILLRAFWREDGCSVHQFRHERLKCQAQHINLSDLLLGLHWECA